MALDKKDIQMIIAITELVTVVGAVAAANMVQDLPSVYPTPEEIRALKVHDPTYYMSKVD